MIRDSAPETAPPAANDGLGLPLDLRPIPSDGLRFHLALIAGELAHREGGGATAEVLIRLARALNGGAAMADEAAMGGAYTPLMNMESIIAAVAAETGVHVREIVGEFKTRSIVEARHEAMRRCRAARGRHGGPRWSFPQIARAFGRDHTTVIYAVNGDKPRGDGQ